MQFTVNIVKKEKYVSHSKRDTKYMFSDILPHLSCHMHTHLEQFISFEFDT